MADESSYTLRSINWRELFPFTNLFRAFRVAVHPSKLVIALLGLLLIYTGGRVMDAVWPRHHLVQPGDPLFVPAAWGQAHNPRGVFICFFEGEVHEFNSILRNALQFDLHGVVRDTISFFWALPATVFRDHAVYAILFMIWFLLNWAVFGGAVARIAAVHVARDEKISIRQALRFSVSKVLSFLFAPVIPLLILLVIALVLGVAGLLFYIPWLGPIAGGALMVLALIGGFIGALVLLGTFGGFNLMFPTVAVEGSDSFDAISRSFSYVFARPWRMLWYTLVALIYGAITYAFVRFFILLGLSVTHGAVSWFLHGTAGTRFNQMWPAPTEDSLPYEIGYGALPWDWKTGGGLTAFWVYLTIALLGAFAISFYFSANTIIYFLMRREVDATEIDDVYLEDADDEFGDATAMRPEDESVGGNPAPAIGTTSAPAGGVSGSAGSADPGGSPTGGAQPYSAPTTENPPPAGS